MHSNTRPGAWRPGSVPADRPATSANINSAKINSAYRADIDGLRAVAVTGVILFHFGFSPPSGGFAGVDIFFVISGFLITSILDKETRAGTFSFAGFYERRLRRILPALLLVLLVSAAASTTLLPNDLKLIGLGFINAATFTSNIYFTTLANDYFTAGAVALQPTLHTWSLAVEAQFYIVFPLLWVMARSRPAWQRPGFALLFVASFATSLWGVAHWPEGTFYLLPTRFWEFLTGGALVLLKHPKPGRAAGLATAAAGLGLIAVAFFALSPATPFPGAAALLPCVGTALLIAAGSSAPQNWISRALGSAPLAFAGRLSYSLYLWHWPILVLAGYGRPTPLPMAERLIWLGLTLVLSLLSWRFVERTIIERRWLGRPRALLMAGAAAMFCTAGLGLALNLMGQEKLVFTRLPQPVLTLAHGQFDTVRGECRPDDLKAATCRMGTGEPSFVLWGNSFARMWVPALDIAARRHGAAGLGLLLSRCPPLLGRPFPEIRGCETFNKQALAFIDAHPELKTVVLGGNWAAWSEDLPALGETIAALNQRGRKVVVILSAPGAPYDVPRTLALAELRHVPPPPLRTEAAARAGQAALGAVLDGLRGTRSFGTIDPFVSLCDGSTCAVEKDGRALYADEGHITRFGSTQFSSLFEPLFQP